MTETLTFEDLLPVVAVRTAPGEYDVRDANGRTLWRMEGAALADFVCQSVNGYSAMRLTAHVLAERRPVVTADEVRNCVGKVILDVFGSQNIRRKNRSKIARACADLQDRFTSLIIDMPDIG